MTSTIDIAELCGQRTARGLGGGVELPVIYHLTVDGRQWFTDKHWLLPASYCDVDGVPLKVSETYPFPNDSPAPERAGGWIAALETGAKSPTARRFAATFGGVLTYAGMRAVEVEGLPPGHCGLFHGETPIGLLAPYLKATPNSVSIPVSDECLATYRRIDELRVVDQWQAWEIAACLTNEEGS